MPLLLIFILVPLAEIALFIKVGDQIGLWWTVAIVLITAVIGTTLVRTQGLAAWERANRSMQENRLPLSEVFTGLCLLVAGALLLTPGFLTDSIGFALLIPPVRQMLGRGIWALLQTRGSVRMNVQGGSMGTGWPNGSPGQGPDGRHAPHGRHAGQTGPVIDGDYQEIDRDKPPRS